MPPIHEHQTRRTAEYGARNLLVQHGYDVARVTERNGAIPALFHLIAWNQGEGVIFIRIGSPRMQKTAVQEEILRLSTRVRTRQYPGEVQFWVGEGDCWKRYLICPGGAVRITGGLP
ncbi:MAG: hypothetical protein V1862_12895 [Methanobacteriota archaeon]